MNKPEPTITIQTELSDWNWGYIKYFLNFFSDRDLRNVAKQLDVPIKKYKADTARAIAWRLASTRKTILLTIIK